jgi:hypothetical protein
LYRYRLLFRLSDGSTDRVVIERERLTQHHIHRGPYIEEEMMRTEQQRQGHHCSDGATDTRADDRVFALGAEDGRAGGGAKGRPSNTPRRKRGGDFRLRLSDGVANQRADAGPRRG